MRLLISICTIMLVSSLSFVSTAQDRASSSKPIGTQPSETQPIEGTAKPSDEDRSEKTKAEDEGFDLDSFFKQGEENAKNGSSCEKPPEPIA